MIYSKSYSELISLPSFKERFDYVKLNGVVGQDTFGMFRYLNQQFYRSKEWRKARQLAIIRDSIFGMPCDLAHEDHPISGKIIVHHLNPITPEDIVNRSPCLLDLENLICVSELTHNALSYSDDSILPQEYVPRSPNDTSPWRL